MKKTLMLLLLILAVGLVFAQHLPHPDWVTFTRTSPTSGTIRWATTPSLNVVYYYLAILPEEMVLTYMPEGGTEPSWNAGSTPGHHAPFSEYLESPGVYVFNSPLSLDPTKNYVAYVAAVNGGWSWNTGSIGTSYHHPYTPPFDFPNGTATLAGGLHTINPSADLNYAPSQDISMLPPVTNPNFNALFSIVLSGSGIVDISIITPAPWGACFYNGSWHYQAELAGTILFENVDFDAKGNVAIILGDEDPTLPVELSSFAAALTGQGFVTVNWTTQSESNLQGYRVYRSENASIANAQMISGAMIPASNTSNAANYSINDMEVYSGNTYWYWLESVENNNHSSLHGPVSVTVTEEVASPPIPSSYMGNIYPNPFGKGDFLTLNATVKSGEQAQISIYNLRGERVRSFTMESGVHKLLWDGKDFEGKQCSSGIYFCRFSSPSMNQFRKLIMLK